MLLMAVLLMSCNTSKEILYFQDINVNQPEVISGARDITVQPKDQITFLCQVRTRSWRRYSIWQGLRSVREQKAR